MCWNLTPSGRNAPGPPPHTSTPLVQPTWARQTAPLGTQCLSPRAPVPRWGAGEESWPSSEDPRVHPGSRRAVDHTDSRGAFRRPRLRSAPARAQPARVSSNTKRDRGNSASCGRAGCAPGRLLAPEVLSQACRSRARGAGREEIWARWTGAEGPRGTDSACEMPRQTTPGRPGHGRGGLRGPGETGPRGKQCQDPTLQGPGDEMLGAGVVNEREGGVCEEQGSRSGKWSEQGQIKAGRG